MNENIATDEKINFLMGLPRPLFRLFLSFQANFTTIKCEKCPSSLQLWDSNPRPLEHESSPITTM